MTTEDTTMTSSSGSWQDTNEREIKAFGYSFEGGLPDGPLIGERE